MPQLQILGQFNTGTNLLLQMLEGNCRDEVGRDVYMKDTLFAWKHTLHRRVQVENCLREDNRYIIILYKNVFAWLYSIEKYPYDVMFDALDGPVSMQGYPYNNLLELYNTYYRMYMDLIHQYGEKKVIWMDYHRIIHLPTSADYIRKKLAVAGLSIVEEARIGEVLGTSSKMHGKSVQNWEEAMERYPRVVETYREYVMSRPSLAASYQESIEQFFEQKEGS